MTAKRILLIEDNADDIALTLRAFGRSTIPHEIAVARSGEEASAQLFGEEGHGGPALLPALVLLDLQLPGMDGFDVLHRIRADVRTRLLPVVILTSSAERVDLVKAYRLGANSYVRKPMAYQDLVTAAEQIAWYWLTLNEAPPEPFAGLAAIPVPAGATERLRD
jgi:two-component system response regulator